MNNKLALASALALGLLASCTPPEGTGLFRVALNGVPGGSFLSVWGPAGASSVSAYLVGGMVGVNPASLVGTTHSMGRLVEFGGGRFTTRCRTTSTLWWTHGLTDARGTASEVWAAGENGTVLRFRNGACETLPLGITFPEGAPTFWGLWVETPTSVWLVGGSAQPTGPKGVIVHYDGAAFTRVTELPESARAENLYKITRASDGYVIVGSGGTVLRGDGTSFEAVNANITRSDNRIFTAACSDTLCLAVGGVASSMMLSSNRGGAALAFDVLLSGRADSALNGVWFQDSSNAFVVGANGLNMHLQPRFGSISAAASFTGPALTDATLHGVGGTRSIVFAVGGELDNRSSSQKGVVLVRDPDLGFEGFTFDGVSYASNGTLRRSLGGSGQF